MVSSICLALLLVFQTYPDIVDGQRPVFPLIFNGRPPWHPFGRFFRVRGQWVDTSGSAKFCNGHSDCYDRREPDEWCPLKTVEFDEKYGDVGCFCDYHLNRCVIERQTQGRFEYADCSPKSTSKCNNPRLPQREIALPGK